MCEEDIMKSHDGKDKAIKMFVIEEEIQRINVKQALNKAKAEGKDMAYFGVAGIDARHHVEQALDNLGVTYQTGAFSGDYGERYYNIYADMRTYQ